MGQTEFPVKFMEDPKADTPALPHLHLQEQLETQGLEIVNDGTVRWKEGNPQHPRNWPVRKKVYNAVVVIFLDFFISAVGTVGTSATSSAGAEYGIYRSVAILAFTSMYFIGQAIGGIVCPPYSESFGRKPIYLTSMSLFLVFSIPIGTAHSIAAVFVGRFMTGLLSATPSIVAAGSLEDIFDSKTRLWLVSVWLVIANLSLVVGPIFAAYVVFLIGWRWVFHISAIIAALSFMLVLATSESRATYLLKQRVEVIGKNTGNESLRIENPDHIPDRRTFIRLILRPIRLLLTEPIVLMVSAISGVAFALIYLFVEVLPIVYGAFGFSQQQASLIFLSIGLGFLCTTFTRIYDHQVWKNRGPDARPLSPEEKLTGFAIAAPAFAIGLWWFAWTIAPQVPHVPWAVSALALIPIGFAINEFDCVLVGYLTDSYTTFASSAFASLSMVRSVLSAAFPLFAHEMYTELGANYATTILAVVATITCLCPVILIRYGWRIRQASRFARYSLAIGESDLGLDDEHTELEGIRVPAAVESQILGVERKSGVHA